jgi:hypothetical protein
VILTVECEYPKSPSVVSSLVLSPSINRLEGDVRVLSDASVRDWGELGEEVSQNMLDGATSLSVVPLRAARLEPNLSYGLK